jgi:NAD(P)-dependent dehydrogenase (short-subunit alcohol dehydrogenase family)
MLSFSQKVTWENQYFYTIILRGNYHMKLENKVAIITGSTKGIGSAMADAFIAEGAKVVVVGTNEARGNAVAQRLTDAGGTAFFQRTNLSDMTSVQELIDATLKAYGKIDVLVNNAGVDDDITATPDMITEETYDRVMNVNVKAPFFLCQKVMPIMAKNGGGAIVNMGSIASTGAGRGPIVYTISKHAMLGLTRELSYFAGHMGIRVNAILPGGVATEMIAEALKDESNPAVQLIKASPAERPADPKEIARVAVFLASDDASYIHGESITVDGGFTLL